jgi:hypothetical protein
VPVAVEEVGDGGIALADIVRLFLLRGVAFNTVRSVHLAAELLVERHHLGENREHVACGRARKLVQVSGLQDARFVHSFETVLQMLTEGLTVHCQHSPD